MTDHLDHKTIAIRETTDANVAIVHALLYIGEQLERILTPPPPQVKSIRLTDEDVRDRLEEWLRLCTPVSVQFDGDLEGDSLTIRGYQGRG